MQRMARRWVSGSGLLRNALALSSSSPSPSPFPSHSHHTLFSLSLSLPRPLHLSPRPDPLLALLSPLAHCAASRAARPGREGREWEPVTMRRDASRGVDRPLKAPCAEGHSGLPQQARPPAHSYTQSCTHSNHSHNHSHGQSHSHSHSHMACAAVGAEPVGTQTVPCATADLGPVGTQTVACATADSDSGHILSQTVACATLGSDLAPWPFPRNASPQRALSPTSGTAWRQAFPHAVYPRGFATGFSTGEAPAQRNGHVGQWNAPLGGAPPSVASALRETFPKGTRGFSTGETPAQRNGHVAAPQEVSLEFLEGDDRGVAVLTLHRPEARNALGRVLLSQLLHHIQALYRMTSLHKMTSLQGGPWGPPPGPGQEGRGGGEGGGTEGGAEGVPLGRQELPSTEERPLPPRVLIVASAVPGVFCAGADLKERRTMSVQQAGSFVDSLRNTFTFLEKLPFPTIAAVDGVALGGGLELALACDIRVCGSSAQLALPETSLAIIPGAGGTQRLPRLVGRARAKELIFTGRRVGAEEAKSMGLVNAVAPDGEALTEAKQLARLMLTKGPVALQYAKSAIDKGMNLDIQAGLALERGRYLEILQTEDRVEGLAAFAEKRAPVYVGK